MCGISVGKCPDYCVVGFFLVVVLIKWASVLLLLNAIFYSGFLSRLVTFLICGDEKVNVAHFSFFVV